MILAASVLKSALIGGCIGAGVGLVVYVIKAIISRGK